MGQQFKIFLGFRWGSLKIGTRYGQTVVGVGMLEAFPLQMALRDSTNSCAAQFADEHPWDSQFAFRIAGLDVASEKVDDMTLWVGGARPSDGSFQNIWDTASPDCWDPEHVCLKFNAVCSGAGIYDVSTEHHGPFPQSQGQWLVRKDPQNTLWYKTSSDETDVSVYELGFRLDVKLKGASLTRTFIGDPEMDIGAHAA